MAIYTDDEMARLRTKVVLFLNAKSVVGARGHEVTPLQRVIIAPRRACWC
jgi:Mlc titration factor MtfA (ptsG expression regulator)